MEAAMEEQILLTAREIAEIMGTPKRTIQRRADKESWPFIGEHGNGGKTKKYFLHGLPMEIRHAHNIKGIATTIPGGEEQPPDTVPSAPSGGPAGHIAEAAGLLCSGGPAAHLPAIRKTNSPQTQQMEIYHPGLTKKQTKVALARFDLVSLCTSSNGFGQNVSKVKRWFRYTLE
jgi:hypothetical protein